MKAFIPPCATPPVVTPDDILARGIEVISAGREALLQLEQSLDGSFVAACEAIFACPRRIVVTGMGKSGHIARKVASTFTATGTPAVFVHPAEAAHGDLGNLLPGDVLLVLSNSGRTAELVPIIAHARALSVVVIGAASRADSPVMRDADIAIALPRVREACIANVAPTTSTTVQLSLGDALAIAVMDMRGVDRSWLGRVHPGGAIGLELTPVANLMHVGERMPLVREDTLMTDAISVMTAACFGIAGLVDGEDRLVGTITDGDLRRNVERLATATAGEVANRTPRTIDRTMLAGEALAFLNKAKITAVFVVDGRDRVPHGIIHMHDLVKLSLRQERR